MEFDLLTEPRISLNQLAREQNVALSTVWCWCLRGIKGHRLESFSVGGKKFTTVEAFRRFVAATNATPIQSRSNRQRTADQRAAHKLNAEAGLLPA